MNRRWNAVIGLTLLGVAAGGCVRRTATFTTLPPGARLFLNDREIGRTPATVDFTWYGDYDVVYRLEGYEPRSTHVVIRPPWYQHFPVDFFAEVLCPAEIRDHHHIPTESLQPLQPPASEDLVERGMELRDRAVFEGNPSAQTPGH